MNREATTQFALNDSSFSQQLQDIIETNDVGERKLVFNFQMAL